LKTVQLAISVDTLLNPQTRLCRPKIFGSFSQESGILDLTTVLFTHPRMGPPAAFAALGANGSSDLGFAPLRVRSLSLSNPHGPAVWRRASHTRSLSASAEDVAQRRNRACQLGPSAPNFDLIEVQQGPHQCGSEISAPGSQYSPRCKGRLRVTELAMAVALAVGCTCTYPAATTADGTAPSTATLQKISGGQTLVTPQSDKASLIPKIDPAGWLDEPPSPAPDKVRSCLAPRD